MKISLSTSLHLNHGAVAPDTRGGTALPMMSFVPVGLLCLKSYAEQQGAGADIRVTELNTLINAGKIPNDDAFYEHIVDTILDRDDALVGLMTDADSLHHTIVTASRVKARRPDVKVCLGGPASSPMGKLLLEQFPFLDYVVRGEGEETFVELLEHLQGERRAADILGLAWRDGERAVENPQRALEKDLDHLPIPDFTAYDMSSGAPLYLDVGRGCPFKCSFCATAPFWKRQYRMKSIERIVAEASLVRDTYGRRQINFSHDIFTCDRAWTLRFCDHLIEHPLGIEWTCSTRTDIIDPEVLEKLAAAGCVEIYYGIETGSAELQETISKGLDLDWGRKIVETTAAVGIRPVTGFIVGYPFETPATITDTLRRFFEYLEVGGYRAHVFTLSPFPESPMFRQFGVPHLDRPAEYFDLPLTAAAASHGQSLKSELPHVFASTYRYRTPDVPARFIDATEEVSARFSMLRSLWPHVLPLYDSPLDFFARWVDFIERHNDEHRTGTIFRHQADPEDLLNFVEAEVRRLSAAQGPLLDLLHYERLKLDGRFLPGPMTAPVPSAESFELGAETTLKANARYLIEEFGHDIRSLLGPRGRKPVSADQRPFVIAFKTADDQLATIQVGQRTKAILERVDGREVRVGDLLSGEESEAARRVDLAALHQLVRLGLLREAPAS